ncbi:FAD-binding oxidoreductase [Alkalihalobacillus sp. 1P02AB]|uniref:FAD-binding oxidoreductase n=1 Tax=Alkalihalobacillus sp. 1P02AB TaxID=3132260 RepID=UPI0039A74A55
MNEKKMMNSQKGKKNYNTALEKRFTGQLIFHDEPGYEEARVGRVFNARRPDRYPEAILLAETETDLVEGVRLAMDRGWQVAVRSGGHSWASWSVRDKSLLIDLGKYQETSYDETTGIVSATPSVKGIDLDAFLATRGRFFPTGHCATVGIGGFLLQGGFGWNARGMGMSAEYIDAIDVVTAEGKLVRADAIQNSELFWAARGAGPGFFGLVTRFHLQTIPRPKGITGSVYVYPMDLFDEVMTWLLETHKGISSDVELAATSRIYPEPIPGYEKEPVLIVSGVAFSETMNQAKIALAPLADFPQVDRALMRIEAKPTSIQQLYDEDEFANPENHRYIADCTWVEGPSEVVVPVIRDIFVTLPTPKSYSIWSSMAPLRELPDMAFSLLGENYVATYAIYEDESNDEEFQNWIAQRMNRTEPVTIGQYLGDSDFTMRQVKFLDDTHWEKLQTIRNKWDPNRLFVGYLSKDEVPMNTNHWQHK